MADTLKASKQGLEIVDRARRRRGWTKTRTPAWWDSAYTTQATLKRFWRGIAIQRENFIAICQAVGLPNWKAIAEGVEDENRDFSVEELRPVVHSTEAPTQFNRLDWGEAPDLPFFYGRDLELQKLDRWIVGDRCKLVTLLGMGGAGKTSLAVTVVERLGEQFECVWWRSLLGAPPLDFLLEQLIQFVSQGTETLASSNLQQAITRAIALLNRHRCLIVLDEAEAILGGGGGQSYCPGYEGYGDFFKRVGSDRHQSCVLLTSREKPGEVVAYEGQMLPVRSLQLGGLKRQEALHVLETKGLSVSENELSLLTDFYSGNPLALKTIATTIQELFGGNTAAFLHQNTLVLGDRLRGLLAQQFDRLSHRETEVLYWLALDPEPLPVEQLHSYLLFSPPRSHLLETLAALERRSLIDKISNEGEIRFTLQPLVMKYVSENFTQQSLAEIKAVLDNRDIESFRVLKTHAPITRTGAEKKTHPSVQVLPRLVKALPRGLGCDEAQVAKKLETLLPLLHGRSPQVIGYIESNLKAILNNLNSEARSR
ncbi:MAG: NB-ARC domain-containing protein [Cyanobacteriota bacterium]|nr:NB-ARC domain-containing protein [Cyanobacteriota bacterium]